ncbi:hypothetical protein Sm713_09200 [Streptomyces sp. TS71-3]|nr:hypothetical protein [Streptomyces sp. TS71-3]GHJ35311.1 hypothetical protein Sm713_09200 [Streptomyces sp. TS71-3]
MPLREGVGDPLSARLSLAGHLYTYIQQVEQVPTLRDGEGVHRGCLSRHQGNDLVRPLLLLFGLPKPASQTLMLSDQFVLLRLEGLLHLSNRVLVDLVSCTLTQLVFEELGELCEESSLAAGPLLLNLGIQLSEAFPVRLSSLRNRPQPLFRKRPELAHVGEQGLNRSPDGLFDVGCGEFRTVTVQAQPLSHAPVVADGGFGGLSTCVVTAAQCVQATREQVVVEVILLE